MGLWKWLTRGSDNREKAKEKEAVKTAHEQPEVKTETQPQTQWPEGRILSLLDDVMHEYVFITSSSNVLFEGTAIRTLMGNHETMRWLIRHAKEGEPRAQWLMGLGYGLGLVDRVFTSEEAGQMLCSAAESGVMPALIYLADTLRVQGDGDHAYKWLDMALKSDDEKARGMAISAGTELILSELTDREEIIDKLTTLAWHARQGNWRARLYLDQRGIRYDIPLDDDDDTENSDA